MSLRGVRRIRARMESLRRDMAAAQRPEGLVFEAAAKPNLLAVRDV
jgi:hypothetical protein